MSPFGNVRDNIADIPYKGCHSYVGGSARSETPEETREREDILHPANEGNQST